MQAMSKRRINKEHIITSAILGAIFIIMLGLCSLISYFFDDVVYFNHLQTITTFSSFLSWHILEVNPRVAPIILYWLVFRNNIWLWRITNAAVTALFCFLLAKIARLLAGEKNRLPIYLLFFAASLAVVSLTVIMSAVFWITGSLNYLWPATTALLALYYPMKAALRPEQSPAHKALPYLCIPASIYACLGQEQVAAVLIAFLTILYFKARNYTPPPRKARQYTFPRFMHIQTALSLAAFAALVVLTITVANSVTPPYRMFSTLQWLAHCYMDQVKYILCLLWALLSVHFICKKRHGYAALCILFSATVVLSVVLPAVTDVGLNIITLKGLPSDFETFYMFNENMRSMPPTMGSLSPPQQCALVYWLIAIALTPWMLLKAQTEKSSRFIAPLLFLAGGASAFMMTLNPAMYRPDGRIFFVTAVLLTLVTAIFIPTLKKKRHMAAAAFCLMVLMVLAGASQFETYAVVANILSDMQKF